jgi:1,2-diacylglycerol 3-beta-glucosyltransferase
MILLSLAVGLVAAIMLLSTLSDALSIAWVLLNHRSPQPASPAGLPRLLFLVPAHDEELLIDSCVRSLLAMRYPTARYDVVVIADNCTDRTDEIARGLGVKCLARLDPDLRGKPHAVAWAVNQLPVGDYDAVLILDADAVVEPGFAEGIAEAAPLARKAVQPFNDVRNPEESAITRMAAVLAGGIFRGSFPLKYRAGLNVPLGCGMCVGREVLAAYGWKAFSLGEDLEWYAILTSEGVAIDYAPNAHLYAQEAKSLAQSGSQRQRWLAGRLSNLLRRGPEIVRSGKTGIRQKLDAVAELAAIGPIAQLGLLVLVEILVFATAPPGAPILTALLLASLVRPLGYALIGLSHDPHPVRAVRAFAFLPIYAVWRVAALMGGLRMVGDKYWIRTGRH